MKITAIEIKNLRGFKTISKTLLSEKINLFIGPNNAGKSTLLNAIFQLQKNILNVNDITIGENDAFVNYYFKGKHMHILPNSDQVEYFTTTLSRSSNHIDIRAVHFNKKMYSINRPSDREPTNLIYPYLSKRKTAQYSDQINEENANSVTGNLLNLYSKIDRLIAPQFQPANSQYIKACNDILGFEVSTLAKGGGKQAVYYVRNLEHIPLTSMGEGVSNILGLIVDLCISENKIFLIEEPENDIHPKALKALLNLIIEKSDTNQFFISTHSNIVMKYLGSENSTNIFNISNSQKDTKFEKLYLSTIQLIPNESESRRQVLEDLGYDFFDFDMWSGWLFLEESSAEVLIREYFIKWFVPSLKGKIRTFSAGSTSQIETKFEDFNRLFVFLHLEPTYKNKVWVMIDGGIKEKVIIDQLKEKYLSSGWNENNFSQFSEHDFEKYYPERFSKQVEEILAITDKKDKRNQKKILLDEVKAWCESATTAKDEFKETAAEVIEKLKQIAKELK